MSDLLLKFQEDVKNNSKPFIIKSTDSIRLLTFNVHMWKDYNNKLKYQEILDLIKNSNADVIGLQEAMLFDKKILERYKQDFEDIGYPYRVICNERYGINMLFSKYKIIKHKIINLGKDAIKSVPRYAIIAQLELDEVIQLVVTHLDVFDETEETRLNQIKKIINNIDDMQTIIMGDFNSLRLKDYSEEEWHNIVMHDKKRDVIPMTKVTDCLKENKFKDGSYKLNKINMSVWSMRRVDYIYVKKLKYKIINYETYPTLISDHYPVYMDIQLDNKK